MWFIVLIAIFGIMAVSARNESNGFFSALKSLFFLCLCLGCFALCFTGVGSIIGVPMLVWFATAFSKGV